MPRCVRKTEANPPPAASAAKPGMNATDAIVEGRLGPLPPPIHTMSEPAATIAMMMAGPETRLAPAPTRASAACHRVVTDARPIFTPADTTIATITGWIPQKRASTRGRVPYS